MAIAGGNITLDSTEGMDKITQTDKVTSPYFSNGDTNLAGASIVSSSLTDTNETYFFREEVQLRDFMEDLVPEFLERKGVDPIRIWSAGCSSNN